MKTLEFHKQQLQLLSGRVSFSSWSAGTRLRDHEFVTISEKNWEELDRPENIRVTIEGVDVEGIPEKPAEDAREGHIPEGVSAYDPDQEVPPPVDPVISIPDAEVVEAPTEVPFGKLQEGVTPEPTVPFGKLRQEPQNDPTEKEIIMNDENRANDVSDPKEERELPQETSSEELDGGTPEDSGDGVEDGGTVERSETTETHVEEKVEVTPEAPNESGSDDN